MKRIVGLSVIMLLLMFGETQAQLVKGNYLYGSTAGVNSNPQNRNSNLSVYLQPNFGQLITDKIAIGVIMPINYYRMYTYFGKYSSFSLGMRPYLRGYFIRKEKSAFFADMQVGANIQLQSRNFFSSPSETFYLSQALSLGYTYFINPNVGLELYLTEVGDFRKKSYLFDYGRTFQITRLGINFGFQVYLTSKKNRELKNE